MKETTAIRQRIYPSEVQKKWLALFFGHCRFVWNTLLEWRDREYKEHKKSIGYLESSRKLTEMKKGEEYSWLSQVSSIVLQQTTRMLDISFQRFFKKQAQYPKFKRKHGKQAFRLTRNGFSLKGDKLYIAKIGS